LLSLTLSEVIATFIIVLYHLVNGVIGTRSKNTSRYSSANQLDQFTSRDEGCMTAYARNTVDLHRKPVNAKYFSTASDKAADIEVSLRE